MSEHVGGVVLAAGAGTRYGKPKVLAGGGQWLRSAVSALDGGGCDDIVVVLGAAVVDVPSPARPVVASDWADGMSASLRAGISAIESGPAEYAVLITVDTPDIGAAVIRRVLAAARTSSSGLARAGYGGGPDIPSSSRAGTGATLSRARKATKVGGPFSSSATTWHGWIARISRRAPISTSIPHRDAQRRGGEPAHRLRRDLGRVGVAFARAGRNRRRGRVQRHLGHHLTGGRLAHLPEVAGIGPNAA